MERQKELQRAFHKSLEARTLPLPTADRDVRLNLRELAEPQTLFGEGPYERRERLRAAALRSHKAQSPGAKNRGNKPAAAVQQQQVSTNETFYTEGSVKLAAARQAIASLAMPRIYARLKGQVEHHGAEEKDSAAIESLECVSSIPADERPILTADLSCDEATLITGGISGYLRFWNIQSLNDAGSSDCQIPAIQMSSRVQSIKCHPKNPGIVSAGTADGLIQLYNINSALAHTCLSGHELQVNSLDFHPDGNWLASSSSDETWRYWDVETSEELVLQEGHSRGVYGLKHNNDGTLLATGDYGGIIRIWDLRVGKSILSLREHLGPCLSFIWTNYPNQLLSSSSDHTIRIWDLRSPQQQSSSDILPGHSHVISDLSTTSGGNWLMSSSHDRTTRIWNTKTFQCQKVLIGHEGFVFKTLAASSTDLLMISASYDRTIKLWKSRLQRDH